MSSARYDGLPPRSVAPSGHGGSWFSSEWSLVLLALVLAVLIWAVVWGQISIPDKVNVYVEARTSATFVAYPENQVRFEFQGPRAEVEDARARLGTHVSVDVPDLPPGEDRGDFVLNDPSQFSFPFPRRLVKGLLRGTTVQRFRWEQKRVFFAQPQITGLLPGLTCEVTLEPESAMLRVPATTVQTEVVPDAVDVSKILEGLPDDLDIRPKLVPLSFNAWRKDPALEKYRAAVELPEVVATLRFHLLKGRELRNRVEFSHPEGYEVTPDEAEAVIEQGYFVGKFQGVQGDLDRLAAEPDAWWFLVRIPPDKLPAETGDPETVYLEIEFVHSQKLDGLRVLFQPASATFVITRK